MLLGKRTAALVAIGDVATRFSGPNYTVNVKLGLTPEQRTVVYSNLVPLGYAIHVAGDFYHITEKGRQKYLEICKELKRIENQL